MNFNKRKLALSLMAALAWGGVSSAWAQDVATTNFDNLEDDALPAGWGVYNSSSSGSMGTYYNIKSDIKHGTEGKSLYNDYGTYNSLYVVTPVLEGEVSFYYASTGTYAGSIYVYEAIEDGNTFKTTGNALFKQTWTKDTYSSDRRSPKWSTEPVTINLTSEKRLAIQLTRGAIDDFTATLYVEGDIKKPTNFEATNLTYNSAVLNWTAGAEETAWQVVYSTDANFDKEAATAFTVTEPSYAMTGLEGNTTYYAAVRAYVSETEQSNWTSTSFTTPFAPISQFPYTENFNSITSGIPTGWDNSEGTTTNANYKWTSSASGHEGNCLRFNSYMNYTNNTNFLKTPTMVFPAGESMKLKFWYKNPTGGDFSVYISNDGGATYETALVTGLTGATDWTEQTINIPEGFTENVVIVFKGTSNYGSGDAYIYLDDVEVAISTNNPATMNVTFEDADVPATVAFGNVGKATTKTFTVSNTGDQTLNATIAVSGDNAADFTLSANSIEVAGGKSETFTVTFASTDYDVEKTATVTLSAEGLESKSFAVTGTMIEVWIEEFEGSSLPTGWVANNWTVGKFSSYENKTTMALAPSGASAGTLITPRLSAKAGDILSWDAYFNWYDVAMTVEYSNDDQNTWTKIYDAYKPETDGVTSRYTSKEMSFTAPAEGNYYLRFTSTWQNGVDNFNGFKLNLPDHIAEITASNIPASSSYSPSMKKGLSFNATVTVKESRGVEEELTAKFYMGEEVIGTATGTVTANSTETLTIECTPTVAAPDGIAMHIEVEYAGGTLTTEPETRYVAEPAILELAEGTENEITTGTTYDVITMTRSFIAGWNTFIAPLDVAMSEFGEGVKVYNLSEYNDGQMKFSASSNVYGGTPYLINLPEAIENKVFTWENTSIRSMNVGEENICSSRGDVTFQGVYSPIAAGSMPENSYVLTPASKIAKAGAKTSLKGFRAYFKTATAEPSSRLSIAIDGVSTGINEMMIDGENMTDGIYNLQGQKMQQPRKGLNIVNGKKVIK